MRKWVVGGLLLVAALAGSMLVVGPRLSGLAVRAAVETALASLPPEAQVRHGAISYDPIANRLVISSLSMVLSEQAEAEKAEGEAAGEGEAAPEGEARTTFGLSVEDLAISGLDTAAVFAVLDPRGYGAGTRELVATALADRVTIGHLVVAGPGETLSLADLDVTDLAARQFREPPPPDLAGWRDLGPARVEDILRALAWSGLRVGGLSVAGPDGGERARIAHADLGAWSEGRLDRGEIMGLVARGEGGSVDLAGLSVERIDAAGLVLVAAESGPRARARLLEALAADRAILTGLSFVDAGDGSSGKLARLELAGVREARAASILVESLGFVTADGVVRVGMARFGGLDATRLAEVLSVGAGELSSSTVRLDEYEVVDLAVTLPASGVVSVGRVAMNGLAYAGEVTTAGRLAITGIKVPVTSIVDESERRPFVEMGYDDLVFDVALDYSFDPESRAMDLRKFELGLQNGGTLTLSASLRGLDPALFVGNPMATLTSADEARLETATLSYVDRSFARRAIAFAAKGWGVTPEIAVADTRRLLEGLARNKKSPVSRDLVAEFGRFLSDPGRIDFRAAPSRPLSLAEIQTAMADTDGLFRLLNLTASAAPPSGEAPPPPPPALPPPATP